MNGERQFISEIELDGEQICIIRDMYERIPPACERCGLMRFCESPRSSEDISKLIVRIGRDGFRRDFFEQMEEDGYYD